MKTYILFFVLLSLPFCVLAQEPVEADQLLSDLITQKGNVGVSAGYAIDGEIKWSNASGYSCKEQEKAFTENTLTRIASISKSMTAVAIMQLVEQGLIDLEQPIQNYLPDFPKKEQGEITTRHLLSHTSGVGQYLNDKEIENKINYSSLKDAMQVFQDRPLLFEPGSKYFYTTYGYVILGKMIEEVSGQPFEEYMQNHIWDKAGMSNTGIEQAGQVYQDKSCLYHKKKKKAKLATQNDLSNRVPGGGFYSTSSDVLKFGIALLEGQFINKETLELMLESADVTYDGNSYGLGWTFYAPKPDDNKVFGHGGGQTGCTSQLFIVPQSKTVIVVLSNTSRTYPDVVGFASDLVRISEAGKSKE